MLSEVRIYRLAILTWLHIIIVTLVPIRGVAYASELLIDSAKKGGKEGAHYGSCFEALVPFLLYVFCTLWHGAAVHTTTYI